MHYMARTIINLDSEDKSWLDHAARERHVPMTELVRQAVHDYRIRSETLGKPKVEATLARTAGLWRQGDGLACQKRLRREWDRRP